jgi:hypothetical protein
MLLACEERLMHLTARVLEFQKSFDRGRTATKDWLGHRIGETDKNVATFLKSKVAA